MQRATANNQIATKKDIQELRVELKSEIKAQRSDTKKTEKSLRAEILRVEERVENLEDGQKRMEATLNKISVQLDGFIGRVDNLTADNQVGAHHTRELRAQVDDHEKRIKHLESSAQST